MAESIDFNCEQYKIFAQYSLANILEEKKGEWKSFTTLQE